MTNLPKSLMISGVILTAAVSEQPLAQNVPQPIKRPETQTKNQEVRMVRNKCIAALEMLDIKFTKPSPINDGNGCKISEPVSVSMIAKNISLSPTAVLDCPTALALHNWVEKIVLPAAKSAFPQKQVTQIAIGSSYVCRRRNNLKTTKLSEHAVGRGIDISNISFGEDTVVEIKPRDGSGNIEEAFQKAIRFGACLYFETVLGPYSDEFHADHLHFDNAERKRGYRVCNFPEKLQVK